MAGVMVESFHLRCFLRSLWSWWADISLCNMKLMVGGTWENRDCFRAGESVSVGFWEIFNTTIFLPLLFLHISNSKLPDWANLTDWTLASCVTPKIAPDWRWSGRVGEDSFRTVVRPSARSFRKWKQELLRLRCECCADHSHFTRFGFGSWNQKSFSLHKLTYGPWNVTEIF